MKLIKEYLEECGYDDQQIQKLLNSRPLNSLKQETLLHNIERNYETLYRLGYKQEEIIKITMNLPAIYGYSTQNIKNKIKGLMEIGYTKQEVIQMTINLPSLIGYKLENTIEKIEYLKEIELEKLVVTNTVLLMQSLELTYAHYEYLKENNFEMNEKNLRKIFYNNREFERQFGITKDELLEKYNYQEYRKEKQRRMEMTK